MQQEEKGELKNIGGIFVTELLLSALPSILHPNHADFKQVNNTILNYKIWVRNTVTDKNNMLAESKRVFKYFINKGLGKLIALYNGSNWYNISKAVIPENKLKTHYSFYYVYKTEENADALNNLRAKIISCEPEAKGYVAKNHIGICTTFPEITVQKGLPFDGTQLPDLKVKYTESDDPMVSSPN
jgi:hypothetical protein